MGAWGYRNFENDSAMDFEEEFLDNPSLETVENALLLASDSHEHAEAEEYLEVDEACAALAAAELVAARIGKPSTDLPDTLQGAIAAIQTSSKLQELARKTVKQVMIASELQELWAEGDKVDEWLAIQADLLERLT